MAGHVLTPVRSQRTAGNITVGQVALLGSIGLLWKSFKRFRHDLEQVVIRGKCTSGLQYILETDNYASLCAYYLLSVFGDFTWAHGAESHKMTHNLEVMDLYVQYSSKGMNKESAEEYLLKAYEQV